MERCPFCKGEVAEDLVRFGGHCPHCLIEIPGEEAPTDPGARARALQHAEDAAANRGRRTPMFLGVAAFLMVGAAASAWYLTRPGPPQLAEFDDDVYIVPLSEHRDMALPEVPAEVVAEADPKPRATSSKHHRTPTPTGGTVTQPASRPAQGSLVPAATRPAPTLAANPLDAFSVDVGGPTARVPEAVELKDPEQIRQMIRRVLDRGASQLRQCYESELKTTADLRGAWKVSFRVTKAGAASQIGVRALKTSNAGLEGCMTRNIQDWKFQRIAEPIDVAKTFRFGAED